MKLFTQDPYMLVIVDANDFSHFYMCKDEDALIQAVAMHYNPLGTPGENDDERIERISGIAQELIDDKSSEAHDQIASVHHIFQHGGHHG